MNTWTDCPKCGAVGTELARPEWMLGDILQDSHAVSEGACKACGASWTVKLRPEGEGSQLRELEEGIIALASAIRAALGHNDALKPEHKLPASLERELRDKLQAAPPIWRAVNPHQAALYCQAGQHWAQAPEVLANLAGEPFKAYICRTCMRSGKG